jgi:hypothetical protein
MSARLKQRVFSGQLKVYFAQNRDLNPTLTLKLFNTRPFHPYR